MKSIVVAALALLVSAPAWAGPSMSTKWNNTELSLERCKSRAASALRDAGFKGVKVLNYSAFGEKGDYSAMVRCATDKTMVFFAVAGPNVDRCNRYVDDIGDGF